MAKRRKQSNSEGTILTIAFILSVMTSIGAFIWVAMLFQTVEASKADIKSAQDDAKLSANIAANAEFVERTLRPMLGIGTQEELDDFISQTPTDDNFAQGKGVVADVVQNFKNFQASFPAYAQDGQPIDYPTVAKALNDRNQVLLNDKKQLQAQVDALNKQMVALRDNQREETKEQFNESQDTITQTLKSLKDSQDQAAIATAGIEDAKQKHQQALTAKDQEIADRNNQIADAKKRLENQAENDLVTQLRARPKSERFEIPDGKVTSINEASGTVWINIGSTDDLKPLTTFSVYPETQLGVMRGPEDIKGRIEVLKIIDGDFAECRIVEDSINDPILIGDQIYSPLWQRGISVHFALIGFFDIDGDGKSDRDRVKNIIRSAGGVIDAELSIDNTQEVDAANLIREGGITVDTQYLVRGKTDSILNVDRQTYNRFETRAKDYNVESITINTLLNYAGYKNVKSSTGLGSGFDNEDPEPLVKPTLKPEDKRNQLRFPPRRSESGGAF